MKVIDCDFCHKELSISDSKFKKNKDPIEICCPWCKRNLNYSKDSFKISHNYFSHFKKSYLFREFAFDFSIWIIGLVMFLIAGFLLYMFIEKIRVGELELGNKYTLSWNSFTRSYSVYLEEWDYKSNNIWSNGSFYYWLLVDFIAIPFFSICYLLYEGDSTHKSILKRIVLNIFKVIISFAIIATFIYTILNLFESIRRYFLFKSYLSRAIWGTMTIEALNKDMGACFWVSLLCIIMLYVYYYNIFYETYIYIKKKPDPS